MISIDINGVNALLKTLGSVTILSMLEWLRGLARAVPIFILTSAQVKQKMLSEWIGVFGLPQCDTLRQYDDLERRSKFTTSSRNYGGTGLQCFLYQALD